MKRLEVVVTKTTSGEQDFLQILSADLTTIHMTLIADKIVVRDDRGEEEG